MCAPKSEGKLRWLTLTEQSPIVFNPSSLALYRTFLKRINVTFNFTNFWKLSLTYNKIAAYFQPKSMPFDSFDYKLGTQYE